MKHREVKFCGDADTDRLVNSPFFRQLDPINDQTYEVQSVKKRINLNQVGFFVYQYAKMHMLQFYYDFMDRYLDRKNFEYILMDTDSAYAALAGESVDSLSKRRTKRWIWGQQAQVVSSYRHRWKSRLWQTNTWVI